MIARCDITRATLEQVREELETSFRWPDGRPAFAAVLRPQTCTVELQVETLSDAARTALGARFGRRVVVRTGLQPTLR